MSVGGGHGDHRAPVGGAGGRPPRSWSRQGHPAASRARHDGRDDANRRPSPRVPAGPPRADVAPRRRPARNGRRRTPGLRREEVATLAGVSVDYLVRLEQGRDVHPSAEVLAALADAMRLTEDERRHLFQLGVIERHEAMCPRPAPLVRDVRADGRRRCSNGCDPTPAFVLGPVGDVLAWNDAWATVVGALGVLDDPPAQPRPLRVPRPGRARDVFPAWRAVADEQVGRLRRAITLWERRRRRRAGRRARAAEPEFEVRWDAHPVAEKRRAQSRLAHPRPATSTWPSRCSSSPTTPSSSSSRGSPVAPAPPNASRH